jgi:large subunit ribosomal protein L17
LRHRRATHKLSRTSAHRRRLFQHLSEALFRNFQIATTVEKAKAVRPVAERLITLARKADPQSQRKIREGIEDKLAYHTLLNKIGPAFVGRPGGYTRIMRLGRRPGDGAEIAILELVEREALGVPPGKPPKIKKEAKEKESA